MASRYFIKFASVFLWALFITSGVDAKNIRFSEGGVEQLKKLRSEECIFISGGGPAGLIAAWTLATLQESSLIGTSESASMAVLRNKTLVIVEHRSAYVRGNMLNLRPPAINMLKQLGIWERLARVGSSAPVFHFKIGEEYSGNSTIDELPRTINWNGPVADIFFEDGWGAWALGLNEMEACLNEALLTLPKLVDKPRIIIINGKISEIDGLKNTFKIDVGFESIALSNPALLIVAEGASSTTRQQMNVKMLSAAGLEDEPWCSGAVHLGELLQVPYGYQTLAVQPGAVEESVSYGALHPKDHTLFINVRGVLPEGSVDLVLQKAAHHLLAMDPALHSQLATLSYEDLRIDQSSRPQRFTGGFRKADTSALLDYVLPTILFGDAAGYATPNKGLGLTLVNSVYCAALQHFALSFFSSTADADRIAAQVHYNERVNEIVDFWHNGSVQ